MATMESADPPARSCFYLSTCWAHKEPDASKFPVKKGEKDTVALLDSGSMVRLIQPEYAGEKTGETIQVSEYRGCHKTLHADPDPPGQTILQAEVMENFPVPVLVGRDYPLFARRLARDPRQTRRRKEERQQTRQPTPIQECATPAQELEKGGSRQWDSIDEGGPSDPVGGPLGFSYLFPLFSVPTISALSIKHCLWAFMNPMWKRLF